jgi:alkanesulfonate monooxygenase
MAQHLLANTERISPLIAVNPIYAHPFAVAKFVSSIAHLYKRKVYLKMVTGTSLRDLSSLGDRLSHQDRYLRLKEFISLVRDLLVMARPISRQGVFYPVENLQIRPPFPATFLPEFIIAGASDDARQVAQEMGCLRMQMLPPNFEQGVDADGINCGIIARPQRSDAWHAAKNLFPDDPEGREIQTYSMSNTDSIWKQRLNTAGESAELRENGYWLGPFMNFQADSPYLVGSYADIGASLESVRDHAVF